MLTAYTLYATGGASPPHGDLVPGIEANLNPGSLDYMPGAQVVTLSLSGIPAAHTDISATANGYAKPNGLTLQVVNSAKSTPLPYGGSFGISQHARHLGSGTTITLKNPGNTDVGGNYYSGWSVTGLTATMHTANLQAESKSFTIDKDGTIEVTVTDDFGLPVAGTPVQMIRESANATLTNAVGDLDIANATVTTDSDGIATFAVVGKVEGQINYKFVCPEVGGQDVGVTQTVHRLVQYKLWPVANIAALSGSIWSTLSNELGGTNIGQIVKDVIDPETKGFTNDQKEGTVGDFLEGQIASAVQKIVDTAVQYRSVTVKDGRRPEYFYDDSAPTVIQTLQSLSVLGITGSLTFQTDNGTLLHNGTTKRFGLMANYEIYVDTNIFGFGGQTGGAFGLNLGIQSISAAGGTPDDPDDE